MPKFAAACFLLSLALYPLLPLSHTLYLLPQVLLILIAIASSDLRQRGNLIAVSAAAVIGATLIAFFVEFDAELADYQFAAKLLLNGLMIIALLLGRGIGLADASKLPFFGPYFFVTFLVIVFLYVTSGVSAVALLAQSNANEFSSSDLYSAADPLSKLFLTKNIAAAYFVSMVGAYLFFCMKNRRRVSRLALLFGGLTVLSFLSRQGVLGFLGVCALYAFLNIKSVVYRSILVFSAAIAGVAFFLAFFDLSSSGDGASQRLELWTTFFREVGSFWGLGLGYERMSSFLGGVVGIDNFHMFFMNQIGTYGVFHFLLFNIFVLTLLFVRFKRENLLLAFCFFFNVAFQTFGYEFQNLFLLALTAGCYQSNTSKVSNNASPNSLGYV